MNERDILKAGLKVAGVFIVIIALFNILSQLSSLLFFYNYGKSIVEGVQSLTTEQQTTIIAESRRMIRLTRLSYAGSSILQLIAGIYLCRGANLIVKMLSRKG